MAVEPIINPNYLRVKSKGDSLVVKALQADDQYAAKFSEIDFACLSAMWAPSCDEDALQILADWLNWLFLFDDQFDDGHLKDDPIGAEEEISKVVAIMNGTWPSVSMHEDPLGFLFQRVWGRLEKSLSPTTQQRLKETHQDIFCGLIQQIYDTGDLRTCTRDVQKYLQIRRKTVGASSAFAFCEAILGIELPPHVQSHSSIQGLSNLSTDMLIFANDIVSYRRDLEEGTDLNLIEVLMEQGISAQQAVDKAGEMLIDCYKQWYTVLASVPIWGEETDRQVLKFINLWRDMFQDDALPRE
ncbi:hypothetical protein PDIDSM_5189 [Penicillium digitatum]|nr:hypothetical protein PDIDSM_5189 [Penicillium digitatum]